MEQFMNMLVLAMISMSPAPPAKPAPIANWPTLKVEEHLVASLPAGCTEATGCAVVNFKRRTCDVYIAWREPQKAVVRERELRHCRGYDEAPFRLRATYVQWLASQPRKCGGDQAMVAAAGD